MLLTGKIVRRYIGANKQLSGWFTCKKKLTAILRSCLFVFLCLVMISQILVPSAAFAASPEPPKSNVQSDGNYLLDRVITWADGSTEHVQIDKDAYFHLDGQKKRLVGMRISGVNPNCSIPFGLWKPWLPENLTFLGKQLAYLQSQGVRIIRLHLPYNSSQVLSIADEAAGYRALLDFVFSYKMLVIAHISNKYLVGYNLTDETVFLYPGGRNGDTIDTWLQRLAPIMGEYTNIIAVNCDNELDDKLPGQTYNAYDVTRHLTYLMGVFRAHMPGALMTHNLMANARETTIKGAVLALVDVPSFDPYAKDAATIKSKCTAILAANGITTGWWCLEIGYCSGAPDYTFNMNLTTPAIVKAAFDSGAATAQLYWSVDEADDIWQSFDRNGNPKPNLVAIAKEIPKLQAPIAEPMKVATNTKK